MKKIFLLPNNPEDTILTPAECSKEMMRRVCIDAATAKNLGGRVNDHLRYKLVSLRVQKTINFFRGPTQSSRDSVEKFVRNRGWSDHARIVDNTMIAWKPSNSDVRRSTRRTVPEVIQTDLGRGVSMFFFAS